MEIPIKNRFEALQAQDPCASHPQQTIIENIKKKRRIKEKGNQTAHSPGHVTNNHEQKLYRPDKHPPPRSAEKKHHNLQHYWKTKRIRACHPATPLKTRQTPPTSAKGARPPSPHRQKGPGRPPST